MIKCTFLGDVMCDNQMAENLENYRGVDGEYDFSATFSRIKSVISQSDYVVANLETPISGDNANLTNKQWEFCSPLEFAKALKQCGVNYVSTANNHCLDRGLVGITDTIRSLDALGFDHSGIHLPDEHAKPLIVDVHGIKLGLLSYTYGTNAVQNHQYLNFKNRRAVNLIQEQEGAIDRFDPWKRYIRRRPHGRAAALRNRLDARLRPENAGKLWFEKTTYGGYRRRLAERDIRYLRQNHADWIIVSLHIGGQYNLEPNPFTLRTVRWFLDHGCNIVAGNHEHVIHGCELIPERNQFATYALGNLLGSAGVTEAPFDRRSEYSIAAHVYLDEVNMRLAKVSFSVLKVIVNAKNQLEVWPVKDLLEALPEEERETTRRECLAAAKDFSGIDYDRVESEFNIYI